MVEFVPATAELVHRFYGRSAPNSFRGWVCLIEGEPAGVVGLVNEGEHRVAFSDIAPAYRTERRAIVRGIQLVRGMIEASALPVYARANPDEPTAPGLLARLGFVSTGHENLMVRP